MTIVRIPSLTGGSVSVDVSQFSGTVVYRQTYVRNARRLWKPSRASLRWSNGFNSLYTSLDIDVSLAERVKRTGAVRTKIAVGIARVRIQNVVTLDDHALQALGSSREDVTTEDYTLPQRLGQALYAQGVGAIAVPAAIAVVADQFPAMAVEQGLSKVVIATPRSGTNIVILPDNRVRSDFRREVERYTCVLHGMPAGS